MSHHNPLRSGLKLETVSPESIHEELLAVAGKLLPFLDNVDDILYELESSRRVVFEGAQGALLDVDHGTYPFVTSSSTVAGAASAGSGVGPSRLNYVLGITKAYSTRVGGGPLPTEQLNRIGEHLRTRGQEFGVNTGRKRRCGWFDAAVVRRSVQSSGINGIALTKIDVLDGLPEVKVCVGYRLNDRRIESLPATISAQCSVEPIYETLDGWDSTEDVRDWAHLPPEAERYIRFIERAVGAPVTFLSTGAERDATIVRQDPFDT